MATHGQWLLWPRPAKAPEASSTRALPPVVLKATGRAGKRRKRRGTRKRRERKKRSMGEGWIPQVPGGPGSLLGALYSLLCPLPSSGPGSVAALLPDNPAQEPQLLPARNRKMRAARHPHHPGPASLDQLTGPLFMPYSPCAPKDVSPPKVKPRLGQPTWCLGGALAPSDCTGAKALSSCLSGVPP